MGYFENEDNRPEIIIADRNYSLGHNLEIRFDSNTSFAFGDTWRVKVEPKYIGNPEHTFGDSTKPISDSIIWRVEIETSGTYQQRASGSKEKSD